jgi:hypothetical protein
MNIDLKLIQLKTFIHRGYPIFPLRWVEEGTCSCHKECQGPGKHPLMEQGLENASTDEIVIEQWHQKYPKANWGMATGRVSGLMAVVLDQESGGVESWEKLTRGHLESIRTVTVRSERGGFQYWFKYPSGMEISNSFNRLAPGIDIRAIGGYIIVPPSKTTMEYTFESDFDSTPIADMPAWLLEKITSSGKSQKPNPTSKIIPQGKRHQALFDQGFRLFDKGISSDDIRNCLKEFRDSKIEPSDHPVSDQEIEDVMNWITILKPVYPLTNRKNAKHFNMQLSFERQFARNGVAENEPTNPPIYNVVRITLHIELVDCSAKKLAKTSEQSQEAGGER